MAGRPPTNRPNIPRTWGRIFLNLIEFDVPKMGSLVTPSHTGLVYTQIVFHGTLSFSLLQPLWNPLALLKQIHIQSLKEKQLSLFELREVEALPDRKTYATQAHQTVIMLPKMLSSKIITRCHVLRTSSCRSNEVEDVSRSTRCFSWPHEMAFENI